MDMFVIKIYIRIFAKNMEFFFHPPNTVQTSISWIRNQTNSKQYHHCKSVDTLKQICKSKFLELCLFKGSHNRHQNTLWNVLQGVFTCFWSNMVQLKSNLIIIFFSIFNIVSSPAMEDNAQKKKKFWILPWKSLGTPDFVHTVFS